MRAGAVKVRNRPAIYRAIRSLVRGKSRESQLQIRQAMNNFILEEVAQRHWEAFNAKSNKMRDEYRHRWQRLSPTTERKKGHDTIGVETGHMRNSFMPGYTTPDGFYIKGHPDQIADATPYSILFGTNAHARRNGKLRPKAKFFHGGTVTQPARPFWKPHHIKRWVKAGIKKSLPHLKRMLREAR